MRKLILAAIATTMMTGAAQAQVTTRIWSESFARTESVQVCVDRAKNVALTLGMESGSDAVGAWMVRPGSPITTVVRCDLPQLILVITAAPSGHDNIAANNEVVATFRRLAGS